MPDSPGFRLTYPGKGTLIHSRGFQRAGPTRSSTTTTSRRRRALHQVSPDLVKAVIAVESEFDQWAVSSKGARGLMQLMPATARRFGVGDSFDARQNIFGGHAVPARSCSTSSGATSTSPWPPTTPARTPSCATGASRPTGRPAATCRRCRRQLGRLRRAAAPAPRARPPSTCPRRTLRRARRVRGPAARAAASWSRRGPRTYYRWRDERGVTHVAEAPPPEGTVYSTVRALD